ncbi:hypothetical protein I5F77_05510, partial [Pseudomonas aeruginosa]|nr:hypothetical protein [Pseudomonas aeruginosa]
WVAPVSAGVAAARAGEVSGAAPAPPAGGGARAGGGGGGGGPPPPLVRFSPVDKFPPALCGTWRQV